MDAQSLQNQIEMFRLRAQVETLREALAEFANPDSWWLADATNVHGNPIKAKAWKLGTNPWTEAQNALDASDAL